VVFMSIRWWRTIHPVIIGSGGISLDDGMKAALVLALAACIVLLLVLVLSRTVSLLHREALLRLEERSGGEDLT